MKKSILASMVIISVFLMLMYSCKKNDILDNDISHETNNQNETYTAVLLTNAVTDIDGNSYDAIQIGNQVWMAENLKTTRYSDGTIIPLGTSTSTTTAYRYAPGPNQSNEGNMSYVSIYGYLYNWPAVMHGEEDSNDIPSGVQGVCPNGWHVPSIAEWIKFESMVQSNSLYHCGDCEECIAKSIAAKTGWISNLEDCTPGNNLSVNNSTMFSALPAGDYYSEYFHSFGFCARFWSTTKYNNNNYYGKAISDDTCDFGGGTAHKETGCSVRCIRD